MAELQWRWQNFSGGQATDKKVGTKNAFANSQSLDFRKSPSQMSVLPRTERMDNGVITDLIQNMVITGQGEKYSIGSSGNIYRTGSSATSVLFSDGENGVFGIEYRQDQDAIYVATPKTVSLITNVSTVPNFQPNFYNESQSTYNNSDQMGFNVNSDQDSGSLTTALSSTYVDMAMSQSRYFQTDIQPIVRIGVKVASKGTGDWTMTVHDGLNTLLGSDTVATADIPSSGWVYFEFTPINANVGPNNAQTYHFHLTSSNSTGSVYSTTTNDLSSCDMQLYANRLVETMNGMHPMTTFQQFLCIGNGRYLSVYEPLGQEQPSNSEWQRQKLTFPPGYEVCGLTVFNEYLAIATERVSENDTTPQEGIIFYWDGLSDTYNYFTRIPEGSPRAIHEYQNAMWYTAGGTWYAITSVAAIPTKVRLLPGSENVYTSSSGLTEVYPYTATVRHGIHLLGYPSVTSNPDIPYGVYSWGRADDTQTNSFGYSYILSTGSQYKTDTNNLTIGMVKNFGNDLYISWRDGDTYGLDVVNPDSKPAAFASWESIIFDNGFSAKWKLASNVIAKWLDVEDGVEIQLKYSVDRGDWVKSPKYSNANPYPLEENFARFDIGTSSVRTRFREIQIGVDIYCDDTVTQPPVIVGVALIFDDLRSESMI